jgi:hypothetical protein
MCNLPGDPARPRKVGEFGLQRAPCTPRSTTLVRVRYRPSDEPGDSVPPRWAAKFRERLQDLPDTAGEDRLEYCSGVMLSLSQLRGRPDYLADGRLLDALIDRYVDWREECVAVQAAYEWWRDGPHAERATAFLAYRAALDREERAGEVYAEWVGRVARVAPHAA